MNDRERSKTNNVGETVSPDFEVFEEGITIPPWLVQRICKIRLVHAWLLMSGLTGIFMSRAGSNLTLFNLIGGLGAILITGPIVAYLEINGSPQKHEKQEETQSRN
jgi:hypothetical protein